MKSNFLTYIATAALSLTLFACEPPVGPTEPTQDEIEAKWPAELNTEVGKFIKIQKDTFQMGSNEALMYDASPMHDVILTKSFYMMEFELTQAQWESFMNSNPSETKGENLPVTNVTMNNVKEFINVLNETTGRTFRLPTEAEWEYAATGGNQSQGYTYSGSNDINEVAWWEDNSEDLVHAVGLKKANELGLYDMTGNVSEWCGDRYSKYTEATATDPTGSKSGSRYVYRGGAFDQDEFDNNARVRFSDNAAKAYYNLGFRLVLEQPLDSELIQ